MTAGGIPLFEDLAAEDIDALLQTGRRRSIPRGTILFLEGDVGDVLYIVLGGQIDLVLESAEGGQLLLKQVMPGDYFGEMALLDDKPRSATAVASVDSEVITLSRQDLVNYFQQHTAVLLQVLRSLSARLRAADEKLKLLGFLDVASRLAHVLLDLDQPPGRRQPIQIRQEQLAAMIASSRQTVSTILGEWRQDGYVITGRGKVVVVDRDGLTLYTSL